MEGLLQIIDCLYTLKKLPHLGIEFYKHKRPQALLPVQQNKYNLVVQLSINMLGYLLLQLIFYFSKLLHLYPAQIDKSLHSSYEYMFRQNLYTNSFYLPLFTFIIRYFFLLYYTINVFHSYIYFTAKSVYTLLLPSLFQVYDSLYVPSIIDHQW